MNKLNIENIEEKYDIPVNIENIEEKYDIPDNIKNLQSELNNEIINIITINPDFNYLDIL